MFFAMGHKKIIFSVLSALIILTIPILIFGFSFKHVAVRQELHKEEFLKYNVYESLQGYDIESINADVLDYLFEEKNNGWIDNNFFNEREKKHLLDVKIIIGKVLTAYYLSASLFFLLFILLASLLNFNFKEMMRRISLLGMFGSLLSLILGIILAVASAFGFKLLFQTFHKAFFIGNTFLFDPAFEKIVLLYPENFFFDLLSMVVLNAVFLSAAIALLSAGLLAANFFAKNFEKNRRKIA